MNNYPLQSLYQKAMRLAGEAHHDQNVPGSTANYLLHLSNVTMEVMTAYYETMDFDIQLALPIAILHDSIEDTPLSYNDIKAEFGPEVADGVQALTKDATLPKAEKMGDSLRRIKENPKEVAIVKLADRITNLQEPPSRWSKEKIKTYWEQGHLIAKELKGHCDYLDQRIAHQLEEYAQYVG